MKNKLRQALAHGGEELDMAVNISAVLSGNWDYVRSDIQAVIDVTRRCSRRPKKRAAAERQFVRQHGPGFGKRTMDTPFGKRSW